MRRGGFRPRLGAGGRGVAGPPSGDPRGHPGNDPCEWGCWGRGLGPMIEPSTNGASGRGPGGRFTAGNAGGPGNPHAGAVGRLRSALLGAVTEEDVRAIVARLVQMAKDGDVRAIREVLDRALGRPVEADLIERMEALEQAAAELGARART